MYRVGLIVPSSNTTIETEVPLLLRERERERPADRFAIHSARMRMQHVTPEQLRAMNAQTERAATELADMRPSVVATACLVAARRRVHRGRRDRGRRRAQPRGFRQPGCRRARPGGPQDSLEAPRPARLRCARAVGLRADAVAFRDRGRRARQRAADALGGNGNDLGDSARAPPRTIGAGRGRAPALCAPTRRLLVPYIARARAAAPSACSARLGQGSRRRPIPGPMSVTACLCAQGGAAVRYQARALLIAHCDSALG